ncbi:testis-expressed protein 10 [Teleopsis dalmanni]|uniref:testis-expressed protein 10 n=1 Tax=Teleopsis dalmanni TaxID=139649 RepID=UPI0018CDF809|nr:testis-expressed protein 10 [Teleopsis dalmanni]
MERIYKKNLRNEKTKVKFKRVKLQKGLNKTRTDFQIRKITLRKQVNELWYVDGERRINFKSVVAGLRNRSQHYRIDALRNIREAIINDPFEIQKQLHIIIRSVSAISLDIDKQTRRESFKTLSVLLNSFSLEAMEPFFHIMSSYLCCGMSHIQPNIREDSLIMLDVILEHVPKLVIVNLEKIMQNFLEMISIVCRDDGPERTLSTHMGQKQNTIKWRYNVLQRLLKMLKTSVKQFRKENLTLKGLMPTKIVSYNRNKQQCYSMLRVHNTKHACDVSSILMLSNNYSPITIPEHDIIYHKYVGNFMPLLLDTWSEVRSIETTSKVILSHDAALTLKTVLEIIENLWTSIQIYENNLENTNLSNWFVQEYAELFTFTFLQSTFPFCEIVISEPNSKKKHRNSSETVEQFCLQQNLCIAHLLCLFYMGNTSKQVDKFDICLKYIILVVSNLDNLSHEKSISIKNVLRAYLFQNGRKLLESNEYQLRKLLNVTIEAFINNKFSDKDGSLEYILTLFGNIVSTAELFRSYASESFENLLEYLPQHLLKENINETGLKTMTILGKQKNTTFIKSLTKLLIPVIKNIQHIKVVDAVNAFDGKQQIMNLFYWVEKSELLQESNKLIYTIEEHITDKRIVNYFKYILRLN